ncbi:MAG: heavy metal-binding domain-containing protein [Ruminococcus sp.]|nr:heavy metal-binding domain-containing protein [Ruminococcus sp.]MCR5015315.1 heavy metal-binding domain-containing protein [Ruminococcus sp.]
MLIVTTDAINGKTLEPIELVEGAVTQLINLGKGFTAINSWGTGGELEAYSELIMQACQIARGKIIQQAIALQADAVVGYRCVISDSSKGGIVNVYAYGTAVKFV